MGVVGVGVGVCDDLLWLHSDKLPLEKFDRNPTIKLWWSAKARRPSKKGQPQGSTSHAAMLCH